MNFGITIGKTARTDGAIIDSILNKVFYTNLLNKSIFLTVVRRYIEKEMNNSMNRWLASYEARRTRGADMSSKGLLSSRFDLEGTIRYMLMELKGISTLQTFVESPC